MAFGGLLALDSATGQIQPNQITALIGPNGAGKTTLLNVATGFISPDRGSVVFKGKDITGVPPHDVALLGISRTFQDLRLFAGMTVFDNVMASFNSQIGESPLRLFTHWLAVNRQEADLRRRAVEIIEFVGLPHKSKTVASDLSYGQQKRLALARAIANDAELLLLDEPAAGLDPEAVYEMGGLLHSMVDELAKTVCLIEHNLDMVKQHAGWVIGMGQGRVIIEGTADEVFQDEALISSYITGGG